jgi:hypothetical protein
MTPMGKFLLATLAVAAVVAGTLVLRPHAAPAVQHAELTPAQLAEIQPPKAEQPKPEAPKVVVAPPEPSDDDLEDGNGS